MKLSLIHFHMIEVELHISNTTYCFDHHAYSENTPTWILLSVPWICSSSSPDRVSILGLDRFRSLRWEKTEVRNLLGS